MTLFRYLLLLVGGIYLTTACGEKLPERSFSFCLNLGKNGCAPPRLTRAVLLTVTAPKAKANMGDFYHQIYFAGDTLGFEYFPVVDKKNLSPAELRELRVFYRVDNGERFPLDRINFHQQGITGFSLIGSILEKKYAGEKEQPFHLPPPILVTYEVEFRGEILHRSQAELTLRLSP